MRDLFVVISGAPGSGKTTLAKPLAEALGLPLIGKDAIKEALADAIGVRDVEESKRLGAATMQVMYALGALNGRGVLESTWMPQLARTELATLPAPIVEVFCKVPGRLALKRVRERAAERHPVHMDLQRIPALAPGAWARPVGGAWPVIKVDTSKPVDVAMVVGSIDEVL